MSDRVIFLPFFYGKEGLGLLTLETFGQPIRYFRASEDPLLIMFRKAAAEKWDPRSAGEIVVGERGSWKVEYIITKLYDRLYVTDNPAYSTIRRDTIENVFSHDMPAELQLAILKVVTKELSSEEVSS